MPIAHSRVAHRSASSRQRILDATLDLAVEHGYTATSIAMIAKRSGLPASSIYWHFGSKDLLFADAVQSSFDQWAATPMWQLTPPGVDPAQHLFSTVRATYLAERDEPRFWRLGLLLVLGGNAVEPAARQRFLDIRRGAADHMRGWWEATLSATVLAADPTLPHTLAEHLMAAWDGTCLAVHLGAVLDVDRHTTIVTDALLHHIRLTAGLDADAALWADHPAAKPRG